MPAVGGAESRAPALSPGSLLCIPQNPSGVSGRCEVPRGGEESGRQRSLLCTSCVSCGQGHAGSLPPALTNCPLATLSPGRWGCGCWGFFSSLEPSPRPDASSFFAPGSCPLSSVLTLKRDHTSLSGLSEGCQFPSDPPRLCGRGEGAFVGRVGTLLGWGRKGSRTAARGFGSPSLRKPWVGWGA